MAEDIKAAARKFLAREDEKEMMDQAVQTAEEMIGQAVQTVEETIDQAVQTVKDKPAGREVLTVKEHQDKIQRLQIK